MNEPMKKRELVHRIFNGFALLVMFVVLAIAALLLSTAVRFV
jgi:hypothetical protein